MIVAAAAGLHGLWTDRWSPAPERRAAAARLPLVPRTIGDWTGTEQTLESRQVDEAELDGYLSRRYEDRRTGRSVVLLLACGRPLPLALHTPDLCYPGNGFRMVRPEPDRVPLPPAPGRPAATFQTAEFVKDGSAVPERLKVYWSWGDAGRWTAPEDPRSAFRHARAVFKLYLIRPADAVPVGSAEDPCLAFARELLPALRQALSAPPRP